MASGISVFDGDQDFWDRYLKARPKVPDGFYDRILSYHIEHGGALDTVHDAGAGVGVQSTHLAKRFQHVLVSDPSEENMRVARSKLVNVDKYSFRVGKLEEDADDRPAASMDMVHCSVMMHFTDLPRAMEVIAHQLKPGGTFVATLHNFFVLDNPAANEIWTQMYRLGFAQISRQQQYAAMYPFLVRMASLVGSDYDDMALPDECFEPGVLRLKLNYPEGWSMHEISAHPDFRDEEPRRDGIGAHDVLLDEHDDGWRASMEVDHLPDILRSLTQDPDTDEMQELWLQLKNVIGEGLVSGVWPASVILATRRR